MAVVIRLSRSGRRNAPMYRLTVADSRRWRDGKFLDRVGWYNPTKNEAKFRWNFDLAKIDEWIKKGAQPTETVAQLLKTYRKQATQA